MPGIYLAYAIATLVVMGIWGVFFLRKAPLSQRGLMVLLFGLQLPMSWLAYVMIRVPLDHWYAGLVGRGSTAYLWLKSFEAPLTEEPAKLWPLALLPLFSRIDPKMAFYSGIALGLGFGVSEIWTLAFLAVKHDPTLLAQPWYYFVGGIKERFIASFCHAAMTGIAVAGICRGWKTGLQAIGAAMAVHYLLNFPILVPHLFGFSGVVSRTIWLQIVTVYGLVFFVGLWIFVWKKLYGHAPTLKRFLGTTICHSCGKSFLPSLLTLNFGLWTGQRCPYCKRWHLYRFHWGKKQLEVT